MDFSKIVIQPIVSTPFEENAYVVFLRDQNECFVVDPGFEPEKMISFIEKKGLKPLFILITHGHSDHISGVWGIKEKYKDCKICIGEKEKEKLIDPVKNLSAPFGFAIVAPGADLLLRDGDEMDVAGITVQVRHTPGHSQGHVVYVIPSQPKNIVFSGDVLFRRSIGRSDFPDGDSVLLIDSIRDQLLSLPDDTVVYPGHGSSTTIKEERRYNPFLSE